MKEKEKNRASSRKWKWKLTETINPMLSQEEISNLINEKLAYIIIELEHSPVSYIIKEKEQGCKKINNTV